MFLSISHKTQYHYDAPVDYALQQVRLTPESSNQQRVDSWQVEADGGKVELSYRDQYGNFTQLVSLEPGATSLTLMASGQVETLSDTGILGPVYGLAPLWHFAQASTLTMPGKRIGKIARTIDTENMLASLHGLSKAIGEQVAYAPGQTYSETSAEEAFEGGYGVCQDHAHIFISAVRLAKIPARYVSGYLMMNDQIDQTAGHAWAEAHIEGLGWVGFDVSNGISPDERYVRVATGPDYRSCSPISGMRMGPAGESMIVSVQVQQ